MPAHLCVMFGLLVVVQLRELVFQSCSAWTGFLAQYCLPDDSLPSTLHNEGLPSLERKEVWLQPLFNVELIVAAGKIDLSPSVEELHK
jgi:hypothetical protein